MPIYVAIDAALAEVTPWRGKETLGHDGYGRTVLVPRALTRAGTFVDCTYRAAGQTKWLMGVCG